MVSHSIFRALRRPVGVAAPLSLLALGGCGLQVLDPAGDVAVQQAQTLIISTVLMLLIVVPVIGVTILFAWRYRASNPAAKHQPDWDHSTSLELLIWSAPLLIIIALGALTWISTHTLDPYRPLARLAPGQKLAKDDKPLEIQVVSLDWKWLFIYPEQGIATVNQLALPINRQVRFRLSSSAVMNSFYVPAMAGQIYTMPGMETKLHAVLNKTGTFQGFSANYSGAGFSGMHFKTLGLDDAGFARWVQRMRTGGKLLDANAYLAFEKPTENVRPGFWSAIEPALFNRVVNQCVKPGTACMVDTMKHDMGKTHSGMAMPAAEPKGDEPKGALLKPADEKGTSPRPPGAPGSDLLGGDSPQQHQHPNH